VTRLSGTTAIAAGASHSLALLKNDTVVAWGFNDRGQLGNGTTIDSNVPVAVTGLSGVKAIAAGQYSSLALLKNGTVMAWGDGQGGALGNGSLTESNKPVTVCAVGATAPCSTGKGNVLTKVKAVAAGGSTNLALLKNGTVVAWGGNSQGQLGIGASTTTGCSCINKPVAVTGLSSVTALAEGSSGFSLALLKTGSLMAWGNNAAGQLGNGTTTAADVPAAVSGVKGVKAIAVGMAHGLALLENGSVMAWGANDAGQVGNGNVGSDVESPVAVSGLSGVTAIAAGYFHSLALLNNAKVMAWGWDEYGELGDDTKVDAGVPLPVAVSGLSGVSSLAGGEFFSLAL
jgi:alpha-tubulin suppressor-like RCC1 family protein